MFAYKFRSSAQIAWALDIIFERRLHCADWSTFNDPREGFFQYYSPMDLDKLNLIKGAKTQYRICCLSAKIESRLLWAHYASGFDGLAVEVELPDNDNRLYHVEYEARLPKLAPKSGIPSDATVRSFLRRKHPEFCYESEVRIIQKEEWYELCTPVKRAVVGHRFNEPLLRALRIVCEQHNIALECTGVRNEGVVAQACPGL